MIISYNYRVSHLFLFTFIRIAFIYDIDIPFLYSAGNCHSFNAFGFSGIPANNKLYSNASILFIRRPLPLKGLPTALNFVATIDPLSYGVDGLHYTLTGNSHFGVGIDIIVLSVITFVVLVIGSHLFSKIEV